VEKLAKHRRTDETRNTKVLPVVITERELATCLGLSVSVLRHARLSGPRVGYLAPPPHVKFGRSIRYLESDVVDWLRLHRNPQVGPEVS
jgi:predicted DNA-binding transcriptional regulator AlpA